MPELRGLTRSERRLRYLVTRDCKPLAYYHSVVNFIKKKMIPLLYNEDLHDALGSALHNKSRAQDLPTGLECGHVQKMKKTIASIKFSVNPGSNERIVTKLRITL